jgi:tetratricopeptide (TPR) repeat protein
MGLTVVSCSVEKNTSATRNFHNLISHYNIYFNANESFKEGELYAKQSLVDDFTAILPVFYYEDESVQQGVSPKMKRAIDKSTKVITFHSLTAKPKVHKGRQTDKDKAFYDKNEYNKWVDDCFLLVGKSYVYQGEFFLAAESFKHVIINYPDDDAAYLALIWLARTYCAIGELDEAEEILIGIKDLEEFPQKYEEELYTTYVDYHIRKEEYKEAINYLELALKTKPNKTKRIRYTFILAQ